MHIEDSLKLYNRNQVIKLNMRPIIISDLLVIDLISVLESKLQFKLTLIKLNHCKLFSVHCFTLRWSLEKLW